jgi:hypothetical protein
MAQAFRAFVSGIIDYAGLFPPARLELDEAIRNYARYREDQRSLLVSRFICPAARLEELAPYHDTLFGEGAPFAFAALSRPEETAEAALDRLEQDLSAVTAFQRRHGSRVTVEVVEAATPASLLDAADREALRDFYGRAAAVAERHNASSLRLFFELPPTGRWATATPAAIEALAALNAQREEAWPAGVKLRTGGLDAAAFPPVERVALVLAACRDHGVPFKATAGLHHPVRHRASEPRTMSHGFLNVFGAGILARAAAAGESRIRQILADEREEAFSFHPDRFCWNDLCATTAQIAEARTDAVVSFGSCSVDEPWDDLQRLGLVG